jgi:hypothetical protein
MLCIGVGTGLTINPETGEVGVIISLHEGGVDEEPSAMINLPPERAFEIAASLLARAQEGATLIHEITNTPLDDRQKTIDKVVERLYRPLN